MNDRLVSRDRDTLTDRLDAALPQTQCTRCGYPDCHHYASAIAHEDAPINRCPPGGAAGIARLAAISNRAASVLDSACGREAARTLAIIDEDWCIGCTLCIKACPVDCIVGASKRMHTVIDDQCTGCELCVPACPVDCIVMQPVTGSRTGWQAWSAEQADASRERYRRRSERLRREAAAQQSRLAEKAAARLADLERANSPSDAPAIERKRAVVAAALARARAARQRTDETR